VHEVDSIQVGSQRRRSERVPKSLPVVVRGIDLFGQPFEERTGTLAVNLHGCTYSSKRHLPKDSWVTLELPVEPQPRNVRARVVWVQRPRSVREFFQVAVELESPANIWALDSAPEDWTVAENSMHLSLESPSARAPWAGEDATAEPGSSPAVGASQQGETGDPMSQSPDSALHVRSAMDQDSGAVPESPLLRELSEELRRQAERAVEEASVQAAESIRRTAEDIERQHSAAYQEFFLRWREEFDRAQVGAREDLSARIEEKQADLVSGLKANFEEGFREAREVMRQLEERARAFGMGVGSTAHPSAQAPGDAGVAPSSPADVQQAAAVGAWNERLDLELSLAQSQWNELLQSSLDSGTQRLAEQLSERSRELLRDAEHRLGDRFAELRQPLAETVSEARGALSNVRSSLEEEMSRARSSLSDIEHVAARMKEYSSQLEASSHDVLNELHRRLENMLEGQTGEMNRRSENLLEELSQRLSSTVDSLSQQLVERTTAEVESKLAPQLERVPDLLRDLAAHQVQVEESLRLHRERLRQNSENNQREVAAQAVTTLSALRVDFESARLDALAKWTEELSASGVRASHAASEAMDQASEGFQQEARSRLQVLVEQELARAKTGCEESASQAASRAAEQLEGRLAARFTEFGQQLDGVALEIAGRARTQMDEAAEAAASSFGQVLHGISEKEAERFVETGRGAVAERSQELDRAAHEVLGRFGVSAEESLGHFRSQMSAQVEASVADGRGTLSSELASLLGQFAAEREARQQEWAQGLEHLSEEATGKHQDRLQTVGDSWVASSMRRLNERGEDAVESLTRSADQSLRDACSKVFEGLAEMLRERKGNAAAAGFVPSPMRDNPENSHTPQ
jgi:hypothetical protein